MSPRQKLGPGISARHSWSRPPGHRRTTIVHQCWRQWWSVVLHRITAGTVWVERDVWAPPVHDLELCPDPYCFSFDEIVKGARVRFRYQYAGFVLCGKRPSSSLFQILNGLSSCKLVNSLWFSVIVTKFGPRNWAENFQGKIKLWNIDIADRVAGLILAIIRRWLLIAVLSVYLKS